MLLPAKQDAVRPKCFFTHCELPDFVDGHRPPTKKQPFATINAYASAHTIDMILPEELYDLIKGKLESDAFSLKYARVYLPLLDIVSGDFFNQYVKAGNVLMLSEGRRGIDNLFSLHGGQLRLELDKATYERCGLVGKVIPSQGRKHVKVRYCMKDHEFTLQFDFPSLIFATGVELDLQLPSMTHGKKGFDRIVHAFKTVLNQSLAWLFADLDHSDLNSGPVSLHHPILYDVQPEITKLPDVIVPIINSEESISDPMYEEQLLEWLGMVSLESPRLRPGSIDRYLCRYDLPEEFESEDMAALAPQNLVRLRWHGFAPSKFILNAWLIPKAALKEHWFALSASTFADTSYSILCSGGRNVLLWECG